MNREEAVDVTGASYESLADLAAGLHALGPKVVVITDGPSGSYASYDGRLIQVPNYPDPAPPLDRTGAGDAFASTIVAALAMGHSIDDALTWAPINSMSVVQKLGAQAGLLHQSEIKKYIKSAPDMYRAKELKK
jgi:ribokinase